MQNSKLAVIGITATLAFGTAGCLGQPSSTDPHRKASFLQELFGHFSGQETLVSAAEIGDVTKLKQLLAAGASPESRKGQWSALNRAILFGQQESVELLLRAGVDINAHNPGIGSAVYVATAARRDSLLRILLNRGANPNLTPEWGLTPLMAAAIQGNVPAISVLLEKGADPGRRTPSGQTAADLARGQGHIEAARVIVSSLQK